MHKKECAIGKPFRQLLAANLIVPSAIDTDVYGTFTGDVERYGTMLEAARAKARLAMQLAGCSLGVSSEGSYGPRLHNPSLVGGTELVLFIDDDRGLEIRDALVVKRTNYDSIVCEPGEDISLFLTRVLFPRHAIVVRPHVPIESPELIAAARSSAPGRIRIPQSLKHPIMFKAIQQTGDLQNAIEAAAVFSFDGKVQLVTDMRAHLNPTRMAMIRMAATRLARRIGCLCPSCNTPGFGIVDIAKGLRCADCGEPTSGILAEIHRCSICKFERRVEQRRDGERADPRYCKSCNP